MPTPNAVSELDLRGVSRRFGAFAALERFDLTVRGGEFVTLLGPSGCGKSTALNCVAGLLPLSAGEIWLDGRRVDAVPAERRGFGMVFQNYALFPHLTIFKNVAFGLELQRRPKAEIADRVAEALRQVRLDGQASKYPAQLSGGQQQRVALARTIVMRPALMLLDEPLSNLDAKLRLEMRWEIKRLHLQLGLTSLYVTHDQAEALSLSDRIVVMKDGRIRQVGPPAEIWDRPADLFVADFIGYRNALPLRVAGRENGHVRLAGGALALTATPTAALRDGAEAVAVARPEDVTVVPAGNGTAAEGDGGLPGRVEVVEYAGRESLAQVTVDGGALLTARCNPALHPGETVRVRFDPDRTLAFPPESAA